IPPYLSSGDIDPELVGMAASYCERRRAVLLVDPPSSWSDTAKARAGMALVGTGSHNAAVYYPRLRQPNPLKAGITESFVPCGAVGGGLARPDAQRGVWKAPGGAEASLIGVTELATSLTDADVGMLNPLGLNCLRTFPSVGPVVWGARTARGADVLGDEYKYV